MASRRGGENAELGRVHVLVDSKDQIDTPGNCSVAVTGAQSMAGIMNGIDGRRACCVDGEPGIPCQLLINCSFSWEVLHRAP